MSSRWMKPMILLPYYACGWTSVDCRVVCVRCVGVVAVCSEDEGEGRVRCWSRQVVVVVVKSVMLWLSARERESESESE